MLLIEVGAFDGSDSLNYYNKGYTVYTFEPNKVLYENLIKKTSNLLNYTVIPKAVCETNGKTTFNVCRQGGASSILPFRSDEELEKTWSAYRTDIQYSGESYEVDTIRLDTFIEEYGLENKIIDFLHIDAQGVDLECMMSLGKYIKNVKSGVMETVLDENKSIYIGQTKNTFNNIKTFLLSNGFKIVGIDNNDVTNCEYNIRFEKI